MRTIGLIIVLGLIAFGARHLHTASRGPDLLPVSYVPGPILDEKKVEQKDREAIAKALSDLFGAPEAPTFPAGHEMIVNPARLAEGARLYRRRCMHCHGLSGDGNGPTASFLLPRPRDFRPGKIKFVSSGSEKATRDDFRRILRNGVSGTVMPSFAFDPEPEREAILDYVLLLAVRGETEILLAGDVEQGNDLDPEGNLGIVMNKWKAAAVVTPAAPPPDVSAPGALDASIARGKALFFGTADCRKCHGENGTGRTTATWNVEKQMPELKDDWGNPVLPADLTKGIYRGGRRPIDLYWRVHNGIKGTPMPAFGGSLKPEEIWDIVNYVKSLSR